jgi:hypothetical protein
MFSLALALPGVMAQVGAEAPQTVRVVMDSDYAPSHPFRMTRVLVGESMTADCVLRRTGAG